MFVGQYAREVLPVLEEAQGTFLLTAGQMASDGDLLRAMAAGGHGIALRLEGETREERQDEIRRSREALWQAACSWLELAWYEGEAEPLLEEEGLVRVQAAVDGSEEPASGLLRSVGRHREDVAVYWGGEGRTGTLEEALELLEEAQYRLSAWRLTA